jgi:hypothetical protein
MLPLLYSDWSFQSIELVLLGLDIVIASSRVEYDFSSQSRTGRAWRAESSLALALSGACEVPIVPRLLVCPVRLNCPN